MFHEELAFFTMRGLAVHCRRCGLMLPREKLRRHLVECHGPEGA